MGELQLIIVPDPDEPDAAEVFVEGIIDGKPYRFLLDTGAGRTSVGADDYTSTLPSTEQHSSSGVFAPHNNDLITLPHIEVGPITRQDFTVVRTTQKQAHVSNLIGMDLLKDYCLHFLFDENRVLVEKDKLWESDFPFQTLFLDKASHAYLEVQCGSVNANAVWDTGAGMTIADINFIRQHPEGFQEIGNTTGTDVTGAEMETPLFMMAATFIGKHPFLPQKVAGVDLSKVNATLEVPMDLIIGYNVMSKVNWVFDFPRQLWAISKRIEL